MEQDRTGKVLKLSEIIVKRLSDYIGFSPIELLAQTDYAYIFGGAIRDAITGDTINDIDILCLPKSYNTVCRTLESKGFHKFDMSSMDISTMYSELKVIFEPITYIKDEIIIQLIRPKVVQFENVFGTFFKLLTNVDLSSSGLYMDSNCNIKESYNDAIIHILCKVYQINDDALMYNESRIGNREDKLKRKGWKELGTVTTENMEERKKEMEQMLWRESNLNELIETKEEKV